MKLKESIYIFPVENTVKDLVKGLNALYEEYPIQKWKWDIWKDSSIILRSQDSQQEIYIEHEKHSRTPNRSR